MFTANCSLYIRKYITGIIPLNNIVNPIKYLIISLSILLIIIDNIGYDINNKIYIYKYHKCTELLQVNKFLIKSNRLKDALSIIIVVT